MGPPPPVVTGISPKEGPPGTRVTIRGENLGSTPQDLIGLIICGENCLMTADWISAGKIIARSGCGKDRGDVIVTTSSGGLGTCTVQFRGTTEPMGVLKESAVFVDDSDLLNTSWDRKRPTSPSEMLQDNPLGISDEGTVKKIPDDELQTLFPEGSGNFSSENFNPAWYLLENHNGISFDDLNRGLNCLRHKVHTQKEGQLSFLKANVGSVMDQLETLNALGDSIKKCNDGERIILTENLEKAVIESKCEADLLFEDVLGRKDRADATRNALGVLQRFKFLFNLPCSIEKNIQKGDYDIVINDYARAKSLFVDSEIQVFKKVYDEVELRILKFMELLALRLKELPLPLEEQKRLVRLLVNLEAPGDPAWDCITYQHNHMIDSLIACKDFHISEAADEPDIPSSSLLRLPSQLSIDNEGYKKGENWQSHRPKRVTFVEELTEIMSKTFPDLWKLGQAYFKGDLSQKDVIGGKIPKCDATKKQATFKTLVLHSISLYANLYRASLLPHTLTVTGDERKMLGMWPHRTVEITPGWLPQCIRYVRSCYAHLMNLDLPGDALQLIQKLVFDTRVFCMNIMFRQSIEDVQNLHIHETWTIEVDDVHGGATQLPVLYENIVIETLQLVKETALRTGTKETELLTDKIVMTQIIGHVQKLFQAFADTLDMLAFTKETIIDSSENLDYCNILSHDQKLMIVLSNCNFTARNILPKLEENLQKHGYPAADTYVVEQFHRFHDKVFDKYMELKSDPIVGAIEQNMYSGHFDWAKCMEVIGVRAYIKEILHGIIAVHAEVFAISPVFVVKVMIKLVEDIAEELARLFSCIPKFSSHGQLQARIDLLSIQKALLMYKTNSSNKYFNEALNSISTNLTPTEKKLVEENLNKFQANMSIQLMCFRCSEVSVS